MVDGGRDFDVAVIGAGEAGRAAASAAADAGASVVLIDDGAIDRATVASGIEMLATTRAWGLFRRGEIGAIHGGETAVIRASSVVVATGARDVLLPFPGWTLAGVVDLQEARRLLSGSTFPYRRVAVVSDQPTPGLDALLADAGGQVVARVNRRAFSAFSANGNETIDTVTINGEPVAADAVIMAVGRQPDDALARMIGGVSLWRPELGGNVPLRDELLRINGSWCWVAGDAAGLLADPAIGIEEGALAGECAALMALGRAVERVAGDVAAFRAAHPDRVPTMAEPRADDPLSAWLGAMTDDTVVCRCEGIDAGCIRAAIDAGMRSINDVKRRTRAGMGACQGAWCTRTIGMMLAGAAVQELDPAPMTSRPPAGLITVGELSRLTGA